jgi:hypothetical protein
LNYSSKNLRTRNRLSGNFYVLTKHWLLFVMF